MKTLQPPIDLENSENESKADYILTVTIEFSEERDYDQVRKKCPSSPFLLGQKKQAFPSIR